MAIKRKKIRLRYKKERVLLSDILPYELPFIFSNRNFYRFLVQNGIHYDWKSQTLYWKRDMAESAKSVLAFLIGEAEDKLSATGSIRVSLKDKSTIPFVYQILHKPTKTRELTIIHPLYQIMMSGFYQHHKSAILYYCSLSNFSIRRPYKVATYFFYRDKLHSTLIGRKSDKLELYFKEYENLRSFFSYKEYSNIYKFYEDYSYQRAEKQFAHLLKFDIQGCFDSIYTHSIAWAANGGRETYKATFNGSDAGFSSDWDTLMQKMNYNETHGIVIGPEFSRLFAECILQHIDCDVELKLKESGWHHGEHYRCFRYVDDYFFFFNDEKCKDEALRVFADSLHEFKLTISSEKTIEYERPFITPITRAKIRINELIDDLIVFYTESSEAKISPKRLEEEKDTADNTEIEESITDDKIDNALIAKSYLHFNSRLFNQKIKAVIVECDVAMKDIINYTLARVAIKMESAVKKFDCDYKVLTVALKGTSSTAKSKEIKKWLNRREEMMTQFLISLMESVFFLYSSNPRVNTTLKVMDILNRIRIHVDNDYLYRGHEYPKYRRETREVVFSKMVQEISSILNHWSLDSHTSLETLYLLIVVKQLRRKYRIPMERLKLFLKAQEESFNPIRVLILLYYMGNEKQFSEAKEALAKCILKRYADAAQWEIEKSAELRIFTLDFLSCPYLSFDIKKKICAAMRMDERQQKRISQYFSVHRHLFTKWTGIDVTKELSAKISQEVYS